MSLGMILDSIGFDRTARRLTELSVSGQIDDLELEDGWQRAEIIRTGILLEVLFP